MPLLESRIKSNRKLQTVREMVRSKNSEWVPLSSGTAGRRGKLLP
jgi:hypothetical protein